MSQSTFLKHSLASVVIACGALGTAMPVAADPIDWASWGVRRRHEPDVHGFGARDVRRSRHHRELYR